MIFNLLIFYLFISQKKTFITDLWELRTSQNLLNKRHNKGLVTLLDLLPDETNMTLYGQRQCIKVPYSFKIWQATRKHNSLYPPCPDYLTFHYFYLTFVKISKCHKVLKLDRLPRKVTTCIPTWLPMTS